MTACFNDVCVNVTDASFMLFAHLAPYFPISIKCLSPPLKQKSIMSNKTFINLPCGIVVYKVEKSKHDIDVALPRLLRLLIEFMTGWLFRIVQNELIPEKILQCSL